jgi:hypothetical protein
MLEYLPPYQLREIAIDGYACPLLEARESDDGKDCFILLDRRFGGTIPADCAQTVLWLLANAIAIGGGWSCHGENSKPINPHKVRVVEIEGAE